MLRTLLLAFLSFFLSFSGLRAQGWETTLGGDKVDIGYSIVATSDGGMVVCGVSTSFDNDLDAVYIIRLDVDGDAVWSNTYGLEEKREYGLSITETSDGGFVIGGYQKETTEDIYLLKIDAFGNELWTQTYGGLEADIAFSVIETLDGGLAIIGDTESEGNGDRDMFLMKTDANGVEEWFKTYGGAFRDQGWSLLQNADSTFLLAGYETDINEQTNGKLCKTDADGNVLWTLNLGEAISVGGATVIAASDDGYIVTSYKNNVSYLTKVDDTGQEVWSKEIPDFNLKFGQSIAVTPDGGYIISGSYDIPQFDEDARLVKTDNLGNIQWTKDFGSLAQKDVAMSVVVMATGGYGAVGYTRSFGEGIFDFYLLRTDDSGNTKNNFVQGNVYFDLDEDCLPSAGENGLNNWLVKVSGDQLYYGLTDDAGNYQIAVEAGTYTLTLIPLNEYWQSCGNDSLITLSGSYDTVSIDFPVQSVIDCPLLTVDISAPFLRRCFESQYTVCYNNEGTEMAYDGQIEVVLDDNLEVINSTIPWTQQVGNSYWFDLGNVEVGQEGSFNINVMVDCDSTILGETHCSEAHIYPDELCLPMDDWSGASIEVDANCQGDSILFIIKNVGDNPTASLGYVIIVDDVILHTGGFDGLTPEDSIAIVHPVSGEMLRLESDQEPGHPGNSHPSISVEGCGMVDSSELSLGYLTQYAEDDGNPYISIDCQQNIGSWDPNDKRGYPIGYKDPHYITEDTELDYIIRFQNTGTDTAFRVVIRDTISPWLDIRHLEVGAASHSFETEVYDNGIVKFIFDDIYLPDSTTNEVASHGFVKFRIPQMEANPHGTLILNSAAIYFDFNEPVITNQTWHTVGLELDSISVSVPYEFEDEVRVDIIPNPFRDFTTFKITSNDNLLESLFQLYDGQGRLLREEVFQGNLLEFNRQDLQAGIYFYKIINKEKLIIGGKLIAH